MKRYAKYKDSGINWIGDVPEHWNVCRLKYVVSCNDETLSETKDPNSKIEYVEIGDVNDIDGITNSTFYSFKEAPSRARRITKKNDIIISTVRTYLKAIARIESDDLIVSTGFAVLRAKESVLPDYLGFLTKCNGFTGDVLKHSIGVSYPAISCTKLLNISIVKPPLEEQKAIAEFLDNKTKQINELVSAKQKQIELLKEYKQAVIAKAVTQGINPKAKMKDSGISWIGQIPEHWECSTLRKHLQFVSEKGHPEEQLLSVTREYGVIVRNTESKEENHNVIPEDLSNYKLVKKGQFAINKMKAWQGSYAVSSYTGIVSPAYYVCELNFEVKEFFSMAIRSKAYVPFFTMYSKGIRVDQWDLSPIGLKTIPLFIPPKDEQKRIVAFVNDKIVKVDSQISSIEKQIANLNEYKQSLISDVVTGKVKVA